MRARRCFEFLSEFLRGILVYGHRMITAFGYHKYQIEEQHSISPLIRNKRRLPAQSESRLLHMQNGILRIFAV